MRVSLTPDDLKKGDLVQPPGWHPVEISDYKESPAESDGSTNCTFYFKIIDGPAKGTPCQRLFNEKAMGFAKGLLAAVGYPKNAQGGYDIDSDQLKKMVGMKLKVYIEHGTSSKGNKFNDVKDYLPLTPATTTA